MSEKLTRTHELKADPIPFADVLEGRKVAEVRRDDRGFQVGDTLWIRETLDDRKTYTGRVVLRKVSHIQRGYGLPDDVVVLSLRELESASQPGGGEAEWMACETRGPWAANSLRHAAKEMRDRENRCRNAYRKEWMRTPTVYIADAYGAAAAAIEAHLATIDAKRAAPSAGNAEES